MSVGASVDPSLPEPSSAATSPSRGSSGVNCRFADLRGVQWRIGLGILPSSSSIDDLRRVTADCRRRYAGLRRHLLVDPHIPKDGSNSPDVVIDNPLSQSPDSMWGRFFRNAELERTVDQDLSRLYPEHGSYFQTSGCQSMLRRILLLWCLRHPEHGYRQGMHELLAPLLYVLHADVEHLSHVRQSYEDHFIDKFGGFTFDQSELTYDFDFKKFSESIQDGFGSETCQLKVGSLNELDPKIQDIVLLCDAYGAEGELGIVLSEKFMEHDAYCMFDALMSGYGGSVSMAEFFSSSPLVGSSSSLPPVIEASSALYYLLSLVDSSLHSHLVALGVEPQYFALRWLRVLFGREFPLKHLLIIWDEIFSCDNSKSNRFSDDAGSSFQLFCSPRGAFISAVAVSMILHMRSSLLATENATSCLQRLLNFPDSISLKKIIAKAKSLQVLAMNSDNNNAKPLPMHNGALGWCKSVAVNDCSVLSDSTSPRTPNFIPDSYWEEKWRTLHKAEELKQTSSEKKVSNGHKKTWSEKVRLTLSRTQSAPSSPAKVDSSKKEPKSFVRRKLLEDLSHQLGSEEDSTEIGCNEDLGEKYSIPGEDEIPELDRGDKNFSCAAEDSCLSHNAGSEENSSIFSDLLSPPNEHENQSERSSIASNLSINENDSESSNVESCGVLVEDSLLPVSNSPKDVFVNSEQNKNSVGEMRPRVDYPEDVPVKSGQSDDTSTKPVAALKERKIPSGKFTWFWKFGRNNGVGTSERCACEATNASNDGSEPSKAADSTTVNASNSSVSKASDAVDQNMIITLRNLGQSMLENIQIVEQAFQQERGQAGLENFSKTVLVGKGQVAAVAALSELRKISNLLCEM